MAISFGKVNRSASFNPTSAFPLDARYYFESLAAAEAAAAAAVEVGSAEGTYFYGQNVVVVTETDATLYVINPNKTLKQVGKVPLGDGKSIAVADDGTISMLGFAEAEEGAQPRKKADGTIEWVVPSTATVDGLQTAVAGLQSDVNAIEADYLKAADKTALESKITTAQNAANDAQTDVDALAAIVGTVAEGKTVVQMIADAQTAATYDDTEVRGLIGDNADGISGLEGQVNTLVGSDTGKSVRTIANEELAAQLIPADAAESLNTLQEIANWIQAHPGDASAMNTAITALQNQLNGIDAGTGTVKKYVDDAITALKIGDYAKASDLTALAGRVTTLEGEMDTVQGAIETAQGNISNNATAISNLDKSLAAIAKSGNVNDLIQTVGDVLVFDCGTSAI